MPLHSPLTSALHFVSVKAMETAAGAEEMCQPALQSSLTSVFPFTEFEEGAPVLEDALHYSAAKHEVSRHPTT